MFSVQRNLVKITKQQQIHEELTKRIFTGVLPSGSLLPTFNELSREFNASRWTVNAAIRMLEHDGLIRTRSSRPARVTWQPDEKNSKLVHRRIALIGNAFNHPMGFSYNGSAHGWMLYRTLIAAAAQSGWSCVCIPCSNCEQALEQCELIDGVVLMPSGSNEIKRLQILQIPHVQLFPDTLASDSCTLDVDYAAAMEQSALYFLSYGLKRIFSYGFKEKCMPYLCQCRKQNFDRMLHEHNIPAENITHIDGEVWERSGREAMEKILQEKPALPFGVLAIGDFCARGMAQVAMQNNLQPKRDFFMISMTDLEETAHWTPALSVQSCPYDKIAQRALSILECAITSKCRQPSEKIPSKLLIRET